MHINMKTSYNCAVNFFAFCFCLSLPWASRAADEHLWFGKYPVPYSVTATNGLELGVMGATHITNSTSATSIDYNDLYLVFRLPEKYIPNGINPNGKSCPGYVVVYEPKPEYFVRFTLHASNKHSVKKTALGASYQLKDIPSWDYKYMVPYSRSMKSLPVPIIAKDSWSAAFIELPRISEMFEIKKPGNYRLILETQVFLAYAGNGTNKEVVHFPPLEIPLHLPDDSSLFANNATNAASGTNAPSK